MNALTENWVAIGALADIPRRGARCVRHGDTTIAVFRTADDHVFALEDRCPHRQGPLSQGIVHDGCVTCPLHNWVISLDSGEAQGADEGAVATFPVRLDGDRILLSLGRR
jgi:nitrite reductase (NADH) small subunit